MIFSPNVINHTLPAVSVTISDSGVPSITYNQIKNSLGNHVYNVEGFYLYSTNFNQVMGVVQYTRYDAGGNQSYSAISIVLDPYQSTNAIEVDLRQREEMVILNGNSNFSFVVLPNTSLEFTLYTKRLTNSFGANLNSFKEMEEIFRKPNFFDNYGDIEEIQKTNTKIKEGIKLSFDGKKEDNSMLVSTALLLSVGLILLSKKLYVK